MSEDFGEGYGKVPQESLIYFHELEEEAMKVKAIQMTSTHCKGMVYDLPETEALKGIDAGLFYQDLPSVIDAIINNEGSINEQQETYHADGSDKIVNKPKKK